MPCCYWASFQLLHVPQTRSMRWQPLGCHVVAVLMTDETVRHLLPQRPRESIWEPARLSHDQRDHRYGGA